MENRIENSSIQSETTVALEQNQYVYGTASGLTIPRPIALPIPPAGTADQLRYWAAEAYGILFVILSTVYIFAMPASLTRPGQVRAMVNGFLKRTLDVIGAVTGIVLCAPIWLLVPVLIKIDSRGPVLYTQTRVGVNRRRSDRRAWQKAGISNRRRTDRRGEDFMGKPFQVIKFRTMVQDAEQKSGPVWATKNDPRITRIGNFMRKTRIDEVPQFFNVLAGDMSLVGPRPERPHFVRDLSTRVTNYTERLDVRPGLTGLAQVENGYDLSIDSVENKVKFDLQYIRTWTIWSDVKILARTVLVVVTGKGAC
jgi:lipopolysaccharide/colanic/teichoic acid biosynthesis glycosyltransferase